MRRLVAGIGALTVALTLTSCTSTTTAGSPITPADEIAQAAPTRPNIVFVLTDDLSMNLISHMPHVKALQKSGMTMSNYRVVDSLCCPSRSAIFTGEYPHDDGVFTNTGSDGGVAAYNKNGDPKKAFALALQRSGYRTGFMGKYLNGYKPTAAIPPGWDTWDVAGNGYPEFDYDLNQNGTVHHYGKAPKDYLVDVMSRKADSFVTSSTKPFMLELATFAPHAPYTPAPRYANAARSLSYPKTPAYNTTPTNPPSWLKGKPALTTANKAKITTAYRKRVEADLAVDDLIANLEKTLKAKGIAKNTYIVFSSDNGYHMGEYRLLPGKQTAFDTDIHVPLIVTGPGVPAGRTNNQLVSNVDLAPTFETLAGATIGAHVDGVNLSGLWHGHHPAKWQKAVLIEHHGPNDQQGDPDAQNAAHADPPSYEAVRTANALFVRYAKGQREYYNTKNDPYELHNIVAKGVPAQLPKMLHALENCHNATACQTAAGA